MSHPNAGATAQVLELGRHWAAAERAGPRAALHARDRRRQAGQVGELGLRELG